MNPAPHRLPTGIFVLVAAALLALGGAWWVRTAPAPAAARGSAGPAPAAAAGGADPAAQTSIILLRLDNGRIRRYDSRSSSIPAPWDGRSSRWLWPCRGRGPAPYPSCTPAFTPSSRPPAG